MPFVLNPNAFLDVWVDVAAPPWETGDEPSYANVPIQKIAPWMAVSQEEANTLESSGPVIMRCFVGPDPIPRPAWIFRQSGAGDAFFRLGGDDHNWYYEMIGFDPWYQDFDVVAVLWYLCPIFGNG